MHYSSLILASPSLKIKNARLRTWGPSVLGLGFIPALPFIFDEPVERVVEAAFGWGEGKWFGGKEGGESVLRALKGEGHEEHAKRD